MPVTHALCNAFHQTFPNGFKIRLVACDFFLRCFSQLLCLLCNKGLLLRNPFRNTLRADCLHTFGYRCAYVGKLSFHACQKLRQLSGVGFLHGIKFALVEFFRNALRHLLLLLKQRNILIQFRVRHGKQLVHVIKCIPDTHAGNLAHQAVRNAFFFQLVDGIPVFFQLLDVILEVAQLEQLLAVLRFHTLE